MKILKNSPARLGRSSAFVVAALLFVAPCLALAPFAVPVSIHQPAITATAAQNPVTDSAAHTPTAESRLATADENVTRVGDASYVTHRRVKLTAASSESPSPIASQKKSQDSEAEERERAERKEHQEREEAELQERAQRRAELARLAKIPIDQAIQIAQRDTPGTVVEAQLIGERGGPMYVVSILPPDGSKTVRLLVNAVDGTIIKVKPKEEQER